MIFHTAQDQWAAVTGLTGPQFIGRHPQGANDAMIELPVGLFVADFAAAWTKVMQLDRFDLAKN